MYFDPGMSPIYAAPAAPAYAAPMQALPAPAPVFEQPQLLLAEPQPILMAEPQPMLQPMYAEPAYAQPMVYADPFGYAEPVPFGYETGYEVMAPGYEAYGMVPMGAPGYARDLPQEFDESHHAGREDPVPMERLPMAPPSGRKKALVIGINYTNTPAQLRGCVADAHDIRQYLLGCGFPASQIRVLTDEQGPQGASRAAILSAMNWLSSGAAPGDVLWFSFSGHGTQQKAKDHAEADGLDEVICPADYKKGKIVDNEIFDYVCKPLPAGSRLTALMDCCHSGTGMDLPCTWDNRARTWKKDRYPNVCKADVRMISGCEDAQTSANLGTKGGALTLAYLGATRGNPTCQQVYDRIYSELAAKKMRQRPQLSASHAVDLSTPWDLSNVLVDQRAVPNGRATNAPPGQALHKPQSRGFTSYEAAIQRELNTKSAPCTIM